MVINSIHEFESNFGQVLSKHSEKNMRVKLLNKADGTIGGYGDNPPGLWQEYK